MVLVARRRCGAALVLAAALLLAGGCTQRPTFVPAAGTPTPSAGAPGPGAGPTPGPGPTPGATPTASAPAAVRYAFPVRGPASYARTHHDYPAADIMAPCGAAALAPVDGEVLEVSRVDRYRRAVDDGATRGGLSISILGRDGARYYGSHYAAIDPAVAPGRPVRAGQRIAAVGRTGDASACHIHFGLSPACARTGDWWLRRGAIWPADYLDAWRAGRPLSPARELRAWRRTHGCPRA
ncbi:hypothetical protein GCM10010123_35350 [Pilimelia anulata]|uniref:M23ase beta-sheet core domain-containing protein n=1 Tax=Pilimelia anulata TaxID=53371 RepID=A0A8J3B8M3_9ACTN|nr:M23 family metallopeptidase [Pilimelia anulata]GGK02296.1 hypothetical protein GCM10010123_35350 [Pilimelia anulata]